MYVYFNELGIIKEIVGESHFRQGSSGVNDLFNSNCVSYSHSVNASGRTDGSSIGIGRYFSAQLIYHFRSSSSSRRLR